SDLFPPALGEGLRELRRHRRLGEGGQQPPEVLGAHQLLSRAARQHPSLPDERPPQAPRPDRAPVESTRGSSFVRRYHVPLRRDRLVFAFPPPAAPASRRGFGGRGGSGRRRGARFAGTRRSTRRSTARSRLSPEPMLGPNRSSSKPSMA